MAARPAKINATAIRTGMAARWTAPEWAIMWEVGEATGAQSGRYADAVMMSLWPSRGLELHGVEIKVSRSDWKREAADPRKAEAVGKFCDRWWVHTSPGVVDDLSDVPPAWGLREFDGKKWTTLREAEKTSAEPVTRPFLAAMLQRADGAMKTMVQEAAREGREAAYAEAERMRAQVRQQIAEGVKRRTEGLEKAAADVEAFNAAFGARQAGSWGCDAAAWGRAARSLAACGYSGFGSLSKRLRDAADEIDALSALSGKAAE